MYGRLSQKTPEIEQKIQLLVFGNVEFFITCLPVMTEPKPARTDVLCRQFPTAIQRAVSSPKRTGSITITGTDASNALSSSNSNLMT